MLIASMEGQSWRYEVLVQSDGFLVQVRDLDTGELALDDTTLFRTAPAALAYADMVAAADRYAAAHLDESDEDEGDDDSLADELAKERDRFAAIRLSLSDEGVCGEILLQRRSAIETVLRRRYH